MEVKGFKKLGRKANLAIRVIVVAGIVLFVGYILIRWANKGIDDAGNEFDNILKKYTGNCDLDKDGIKDSKDVCPCDPDDYFYARIYYITGVPLYNTGDLQCEVRRQCRYDKLINGIPVPTYSQCTPDDNVDVNKPGHEDFEYFFFLSGTCEKAFEQAGGLKGIKELYPEACSDIKKEDAVYDSKEKYKIVFSHSCAKKVLATNVETGELTFSCATPTSKCKKKLIDQEC